MHCCVTARPKGVNMTNSFGQTAAPTIAIVGSFRQFLADVSSAREVFVQAGVVVTSPRDSVVIEPGIDFVRFPSDREDLDDATVQTVALHRILGADAVYVVAPAGYVGKTTCYELGRIIQLDRPLYFSEMPCDLPVHVPPGAIVTPAELADVAADGSFKRWSEWGDGMNHELERDLLEARPDTSL